MSDKVVVDDEGIADLKGAMLEAGEAYKDNLSRLKKFVEEITNGDIQGDPAIELKQKFEEKESKFLDIADAIDEAEENMGIQRTKFQEKLSAVRHGMK